MMRSQKLRLKRWTMREIDRSLLKAPFGSASLRYIASAEVPGEKRAAVAQ